MATFIGRRQELELLGQAYSSRGSAFIPIYGRRRVGKSELILTFMKDIPGVYYVGKKAPPELQIREFLREAAVVVGDPLLAELSDPTWRRALEITTERWRGPEKLIVAFDEFQWMVESSPELPSILQELWDRRWRRDGKQMLLLCGSYIDFMEREVLGSKSPLYGRRTAQILLRPFGYREAAAFHPRYAIADQAKTYFVCGGVPLYLAAFSSERSVAKNIEANLLTEFAPLFREPDFLLREELREVENYYALLMAIASGAHTNAAISHATGLPERSLHYYVKQLVELGYVGRRHPLTQARANPRQVRYAIDDPLLRFWFRFVFPNTSFALLAGATRAMRERIRPALDAYFGECFERLCREALPEIYERDGLSVGYQIGEYWDKQVQIDVVAVRDDDWIDLGECKWGSVRSAPALRSELEGKVAAYPNRRGATIGRHVFVRDKPERLILEDSGVRWHTLKDLYSNT